MADDDDELHDEIPVEPEDDFEPDIVEDLDPEELDEDDLVVDDEFAADDDEFAADDDDVEEVDDLADTPRRPAPVVAKDSEEDDDDEDMLTPDDVEADLDTILKDRLVANDDGQDEDEEGAEIDDPRSEPGDRLQPKRPDEQLCPTCFLLVRAKAPNCPMDDDSCPIFN